MKLVIIALVFNFLLSCWPKLDIITKFVLFLPPALEIVDREPSEKLGSQIEEQV